MEAAEGSKEEVRVESQSGNLKVSRGEPARKGAERGMGYGDILMEGGGAGPPIAFERNTAYVPHTLPKK